MAGTVKPNPKESPLYPGIKDPDLRARAIRVHYALHRVWTKAVGTKSYVKTEWTELGAAIDGMLYSAEGPSLERALALIEHELRERRLLRTPPQSPGRRRR